MYILVCQIEHTLNNYGEILICLYLFMQHVLFYSRRIYDNLIAFFIRITHLFFDQLSWSLEFINRFFSRHNSRLFPSNTKSIRRSTLAKVEFTEVWEKLAMKWDRNFIIKLSAAAIPTANYRQHRARVLPSLFTF